MNNINLQTLQTRENTKAEINNNMHKVIDAAESKFNGQVTRASEHGRNQWVITVKRINFMYGDDRAYLRTTGVLDAQGHVYFYQTVYDLTLEQSTHDN